MLGKHGSGLRGGGAESSCWGVHCSEGSKRDGSTATMATFVAIFWRLRSTNSCDRVTESTPHTQPQNPAPQVIHLLASTRRIRGALNSGETWITMVPSHGGFCNLEIVTQARSIPPPGSQSCAGMHTDISAGQVRRNDPSGFLRHGRRVDALGRLRPARAEL